MKIAYGKLGRSIPLTLEAASNVGGDVEVVNLFTRLLDEGHEVHLISRSQGNKTDRAFPNVIDHFGPGGVFEGIPEADRHQGEKFTTYNNFLLERAAQLPKFDAAIIWLGQHGSTLHPLPAVQDAKLGTYTNPMVSDVNYGYPLVVTANVLQARDNLQPIWMCPDPRNMIKFRDLWDPRQRTVLAQYNTRKDNTFYDERVGKLYSGGTRYEYSGIEMLAIAHHTWTDDDSFLTSPTPEKLFGLLVNEGYSNLGNKGRLALIKSWCRDDFEMFGTWCEASMNTLGRRVTPVAFKDVNTTLNRWRATMTFPATGGGWATAKPWECFHAGTICFKHPDYDTQGHIYNKALMGDELYTFLCPPTYSGFYKRLDELKTDATYKHYAMLQRTYLNESVERLDDGFALVNAAMQTGVK